MLGYIVPNKPELKVREAELYGGYYCGLCKSVERRHGQLPRFALNYDAVFLALVLSALEEADESVSLERCPVHPLKRRVIVQGRPSMDYAADMMVLLTGFKLMDDRRDEGGIKALAGLAALRRSLKKIMKWYPEKGIMMERRLAELNRLEETGTTSPDQAGEPFARLLEDVFDWSPAGKQAAHTAEETRRIEALKRLGYHLGRWIYLIDAFDDLASDSENGSYNPLLLQYRANGGAPEASPSEVRKAVGDRVRFNLHMHLGQLAEAWEALGAKRNRGLIENIIYSGLSLKTAAVLKGGQTDKEGTTEYAQPL